MRTSQATAVALEAIPIPLELNPKQEAARALHQARHCEKYEQIQCLHVQRGGDYCPAGGRESDDGLQVFADDGTPSNYGARSAPKDTRIRRVP